MKEGVATSLLIAAVTLGCGRENRNPDLAPASIIPPTAVATPTSALEGAPMNMCKFRPDDESETGYKLLMENVIMTGH